MDQQQLLNLRRACKEAAIAILHPGASEGQVAVVTEKIYVQAAATAIGAKAMQEESRNHLSVNDTLDALNRGFASPDDLRTSKLTPSPSPG